MKEKQKQHIISIMKKDEELGLYEETKCYCGHTTTCECGLEEPKQETLEEAALNIIPDRSTAGWIDSFGAAERIGFIAGAKWQQEQDKNKYSDSDMTNYALYILHNDVITPKEWFEQFKKK